MTLLLDTQIWLWWVAGSKRFSPNSKAAVLDPENRLVLSAASAWEIAIKYALGKLALPLPPSTFLQTRLAMQGVSVLEISLRHAAEVALLPHHHRDPFDRLLIAQALLEGMTMLTSDAAIARYEVAHIMA